MSDASSPLLHRSKAVLLTGIYSMAHVLGWGSALLGTSFTLFPSVAHSQLPTLPSTPLPPQSQPSTQPSPPSPIPSPGISQPDGTSNSQPAPSRQQRIQQLLEEARQRLRERGDLPPSDDPAQTPAGPSQLPAVRPKTPLSFYRLGVGDSIVVNVQRFTDLNFQGVIDPEGNIMMPLLGRVPVDGLTLEETEERLRTELNRYVIDPVVRVSLGAQRPVQVTIVGEVVEPGFYNLNAAGAAGSGLPRVSAALLAAGGTTERADLRAIKVRRQLLDGTFIEQNIDLFTPLKNGDQLPDLNLQDRDVVSIARLTAASMQDYDRDLVARSTIAQPQINVRVLSYPNNSVSVIRLPNGSTFMDALTTIGPNPDTANLGSIALVRFDPEQGKAVTRQLNGEGLLRGDISQNVPLENNDVIIVGRNWVAQITYALSTFTQPFRDVLGFLLFFDSLTNSAGNLFRPGGSRGSVTGGSAGGN